MITIVEPKKHIADLWGQQRVKQEATFRQMRYVLRVDHEGKTLLHNVVTGQLAVLSPEEAEALETLPSPYAPVMEELIKAHYLVPEDYDEHRQVVNLKNILHRFTIAESYEGTAITHYTILPTTACNARCYYCYEHDVRKVTMTEQTAADTIRFIVENCGPEKKIDIRWFGGEPTVAVERIDQICKGLRDHGVQIVSDMTTNGYLFDEAMVQKARTLWNLKSVMISVDGVEVHYNEIKDFIDTHDNPYQRVLRNVGLLLDAGVSVGLRMNFDIGNYQDFHVLLNEAKERYHGNKHLRVFAFPVKGEYPDKSGEIHHPGLAWSVDRLVELNDAACEANLFRRITELPSLYYTYCSAGTPSFMIISPEGKLGRCLSIFDRADQIIGDVTSGIMTPNYCDAWRHLAVPTQCSNCTLLPSCILIEGCPGGTDCFKKESFRKTEIVQKKAYEHWKTDMKGEMYDGIRGTEGGICSD